jgi:hypothetical protein
LPHQSASFLERKGKVIASRRHRFEAYLDKVFDFSAAVEALPDGRKFPRHQEKKVFDAVFLGAACQFPALHRIETECQQGALCRRIGPLSEDAIGYALERSDPQALFTLGCALARQLKRNGVLRSNWSRGLVVAAIDGIEICSSFARSCEHCMQRQVRHVVDGELREQTQYYHRICVVAIVSSAFPIPLGIRFQKNGESEVACSLALLKDLIEKVGSRFLDLLVFDALYLQTPFTAEVEALGLDWVGNLNETSTNFYVSNLEWGSIPPLLIHQLGRSRWLIDSEVFQTMTTDGHLKRPSVHQDQGQALIALTMIRVLAFTLTQVFFHPQMRSRFRKSSFGFCDLARRLADQFLVLAQTNSS